ncbi:MAG: hypothetical protein CMJ19_17050 [Phycisphaeraceae bacterium]|nr:hypothetical protein [Phycisphaeraceae bacterium]
MNLTMQHPEPAMRTDLKPWATCSIKPVWDDAQVHALHAYFNCCPESPDGQWVALFVSGQAQAHVGELWLINRHDQQTMLVDQQVHVEDAHRQAMQQWVCNGESLVYMSEQNGTWQVKRFEIKTRKLTVIHEDAQLFVGSPLMDVVPLYGKPWQPDGHQDLMLLDIRSGIAKTVLTLDQVLADFSSQIKAIFTDVTPDCIAYPVLSPDGSRVMFKLSAVGDGQYRSPHASRREGLFVYELQNTRPLGFYPSWGHPAWMPDSKHILRMKVIIDTDSMQVREIPWYPAQSNSHASPSPEGQLLVMDVARDAFTQHEFHWAIVVGDDAQAWQHLHTDPSPRHGTTSWRPVHPHPVFSTDGQQIYFNVNFGEWTRVCVAEVG